MQPDNELLRQYATAGSEAAFAELVKRHVNLVYSAALRQTAGDTHLAHDVAQSVFTDLARKADSLLNRESLSGWLYTSAYFAANKLVRTETRRRQREEQFMREPTHETPPEANWEKLRPLLDAAMHSLKESDREAILLRYFENRPYAEVGARFGLNENAARLRVERALEKLRALLAKRGLAAGTTLASILSANAIQTAPATLATQLARASVTGAAAKVAPVTSVTRIRFAVTTLALVSALTMLVIEHYSQHASAKNVGATQRSAGNFNRGAMPAEALADPQTTPADELQTASLNFPIPASSNDSNTPPSPAASATNTTPFELVDLVNLVVRIAAVPNEEMPRLSFGWAPAGNGASILSAEQYGKIDDSLLAAGGVQLRTLTVQLVANGYPAESGVAQSVTIDDTNANIAMIVGVTPAFNSSVFSLNAVARFSPLYGDPSQRATQFLQISNQVHMFSDQSAVLETEIPTGDWLDNALSLRDGKYKLLVFFKPAILPGKVRWLAHFNHVKLESLTQGPAPFE